MPLSLELVFIFILLIWLLGITFYFLRIRKQYGTFIDGSDKDSLAGFLENVTHNLNDTKKVLKETSIRIQKLEDDGMLHIQKIGLLRFNPFRDTGGEQSFILSLVDANDSGIVISALYSRSGTRWYAKKVLLGKGEEHELSDEEHKAIRLAKNIKKP